MRMASRRQGFGILEVLIAAVVLGFLIIGLNTLQKGNRESVLRIRARDAASFVAQHVLDSLGSTGINSLKAKEESKCENKTLVYCEPEYTYNFEGKQQGIIAPIKYRIEVEFLNENKQAIDTTRFAKDTNIYAKSLEATISWDFKKTNQSIKVAKVVR